MPRSRVRSSSSSQGSACGARPNHFCLELSFRHQRLPLHIAPCFVFTPLYPNLSVFEYSEIIVLYQFSFWCLPTATKGVGVVVTCPSSPDSPNALRWEDRACVDVAPDGVVGAETLAGCLVCPLTEAHLPAKPAAARQFVLPHAVMLGRRAGRAARLRWFACLTEQKSNREIYALAYHSPPLLITSRSSLKAAQSS